MGKKKKYKSSRIKNHKITRKKKKIIIIIKINKKSLTVLP